jgi:hypothetical protein
MGYFCIIIVMEKVPRESVDPLKSEHLKEGTSPIMVCVGTPEQFDENPGDEEKFFLREKSSHSIHNVDYFGDPSNLVEQGFKNAGRRSYVISPVDTLDKFSRTFKNCTGMIVTGQDKETGENISFMSHQYPGHFLLDDEAGGKFGSDLRERLRELKEKSVDGTIDAVIVGGNYLKKAYFKRIGESDDAKFRHNYIDSIKLLSTEVQIVFGFEPVVITGPKMVGGADDIFYDNKHRRLYAMRPEVGKKSTKSFMPKDIETEAKKW